MSRGMSDGTEAEAADSMRDGNGPAGGGSRKPMWATDTGARALDTRRALVALIRGPYLSGRSHPQLWRSVLGDETALRARLSDMFLELVVDTDSRLAFVRNAEVPDAQIPAVVRTHTLTFLDTALLLHLRHELLRVDRSERVIVGADESREALRVYGNAYGLDEVGFAKRFNASWTKMRTYGLLADTATEGRLEISPVLRLIFGPEEIRAVSDEFERRLAEAGTDSAQGGGGLEEEPEAVEDDG